MIVSIADSPHNDLAKHCAVGYCLLAMLLFTVGPPSSNLSLLPATGVSFRTGLTWYHQNLNVIIRFKWNSETGWWKDIAFSKWYHNNLQVFKPHDQKAVSPSDWRLTAEDGNGYVASLCGRSCNRLPDFRLWRHYNVSKDVTDSALREMPAAAACMTLIFHPRSSDPVTAAANLGLRRSTLNPSSLSQKPGHCFLQMQISRSIVTVAARLKFYAANSSCEV